MIGSPIVSLRRWVTEVADVAMDLFEQVGVALGGDERGRGLDSCQHRWEQVQQDVQWVSHPCGRTSPSVMS